MPSFFNIPAVVAVAVVCLLVAYAAHRRSVKRTAPDLRAEVRAEQEAVGAAIEALPAQIERAKRSHSAAAAASGDVDAEGLRQWLREVTLDLSEAELLKSQLSAADSAPAALSEMDLEIQLVEVLGLSVRASALADKYRAAIVVHESNLESLAESDALQSEAAQFSLTNPRPSIRESAV